jgi:Flp pilus assembly protein TadD
MQHQTEQEQRSPHPYQDFRKRFHFAPARLKSFALVLSLATFATLGSVLLGLGCATPDPTRDLRARARAYYSEGAYSEAAVAIEQAVELSPEDPSLRREAARIAVRAGDANRALAHLEAALRSDDEDPALWSDVAELERDRQNYADAYVAYRRAAELDPEDVRAVSGLALIADHLGFEEEARAAYARWNELEQRNEVPTPTD